MINICIYSKGRRGQDMMQQIQGCHSRGAKCTSCQLQLYKLFYLLQGCSAELMERERAGGGGGIGKVAVTHLVKQLSLPPEEFCLLG